MEQDPIMLLQSVEAVHAATTLDEALQSLVTVLQSRFELWHASLATLPAGSSQIQVVASWSLMASVFDVGAEVSAESSPGVAAVIGSLRRGRPVLLVTSGRDSLVDDLLVAQGVASVVCLPVHCDDDSLLLLTLGSGSKDAFHRAAPGFFDGIGAGIRNKIWDLANPNPTG